MFNPSFIRNAINRSAQNGADRRRFLKVAGAAGLGFAGATYLGAGSAVAGGSSAPSQEGGPSDAAILNFALNLEYLEAEFYQRAVRGEGLPDDLIGGTTPPGGVSGGRQVEFESDNVRAYAEEIAADELAHVRFLRSALGGAAVSRPAIDIDAAFQAAAMAAGLATEDEPFDAYASEENFILAAYIFEDVGVTAYKGAAPLIDNPTFVEAAAGILAVEAYHAANIRTVIAAKGLEEPSVAISDARDSLDGESDIDQGVLLDGQLNIVPSDANSIVFSRTPGQVLNVVYLTPQMATSGGFFPAGVNGELNTSDANA